MPLQLIGQVIAHTPAWVWGMLIVVTLLGLRQASDQVITSGRIIGFSAGWTIFSIWGVGSGFGFSAGVLLAWATGLGLSLAAQQRLVSPRGVQALGEGRYAVAGSLWPLLTIWLVFGVRYVTSVMVVLDPALKQDTTFDLAVPAVYGALSGLFVGRALRVLRSAPGPGALATA